MPGPLPYLRKIGRVLVDKEQGGLIKISVFAPDAPIRDSPFRLPHTDSRVQMRRSELKLAFDVCQPSPTLAWDTVSAMNSPANTPYRHSSRARSCWAPVPRRTTPKRPRLTTSPAWSQPGAGPQFHRGVPAPLWYSAHGTATSAKWNTAAARVFPSSRSKPIPTGP